MFYPIIAFALLNLVYVAGQLFASFVLNLTEPHYFFGFGRQLVKFRIRGVQFSLGLYIPIVGLSRIYTVVNGEKQQARYPWQFFDRPVGRRLLTTLSGAIALLIAGILIFIVMAYGVDESIITKDEVNKYGIYPSERAEAVGLRRGDRIIAINGKDYLEYSELIAPEILQSSGSYYTVLRGDATIDIRIHGASDDGKGKNSLFVSLLVPFKIADVQPYSPAERAGITKGDRIVKVNDQPIVKFFDMLDAFQRDDDGAVEIQVERQSRDSLKTLNLSVTTDDGRIGVYPQELINYTPVQNSLPEAIQKGTRRAFSALRRNVRSLVMLTSGRIPKASLGGPVRIESATGSVFWSATGVYAMLFAFWNLLPLPKSAFWEIIPLIYEWVTKKKYSYNIFRDTIKIAWLLVAAALIWVMLNDLAKLFS